MQLITSWLTTKFGRKYEKKQVVSYYNYKMALIKYRYSRTPFPHPHTSTIHAIPYFFIGIICGPISGSFPVRDHLRSNSGIISGSGSFAVQFGDYLRFRIICGPGIICGPVQYSQKNWVRVCGPLPKTLTLFMTQVCDFPCPIYDLTKNLIAYL